MGWLAWAVIGWPTPSVGGCRRVLPCPAQSDGDRLNVWPKTIDFMPETIDFISESGPKRSHVWPRVIAPRACGSTGRGDREPRPRLRKTAAAISGLPPRPGPGDRSQRASPSAGLRLIHSRRLCSSYRSGFLGAPVLIIHVRPDRPGRKSVIQVRQGSHIMLPGGLEPP
jgi:hypothetical protein